MNNKVEIEEKVLAISYKALSEWGSKLDKISITVDPLFIYRNNDDKNYFSEIEFNFWKFNSLETCFSIVIFMNGQLLLDIEEIEKYVYEEIENSYQEICQPK